MTTASDMHGKAALVTGAAAGLGRATALRLARAGAEVCLVTGRGMTLNTSSCLILGTDG